jgi:hypothetical protein
MFRRRSTFGVKTLGIVLAIGLLLIPTASLIRENREVLKGNAIIHAQVKAQKALLAIIARNHDDEVTYMGSVVSIVGVVNCGKLSGVMIITGDGQIHASDAKDLGQEQLDNIKQQADAMDEHASMLIDGGCSHET